MSETVLLQGFLTAMLWTVEATLLLLMAGGLTRSFRNSAGLRHLIWLTAFCGLLLIPCLSILVPPLVVVRTPTTDSIKTLLDKSNSQKWIAEGDAPIACKGNLIVATLFRHASNPLSS